MDALPYLGPRLPVVAVGDLMVDRSFRWSDCGRSVFGGPPRLGWVPRSLLELAARVGRIVDVWAWPERLAGSDVWRVERGRAERPKEVVGAAGELAGDRQRRAGVRQAAVLERVVVGVVGAGGRHADWAASNSAQRSGAEPWRVSLPSWAWRSER